MGEHREMSQSKVALDILSRKMNDSESGIGYFGIITKGWMNRREEIFVVTDDTKTTYLKFMTYTWRDRVRGRCFFFVQLTRFSRSVQSR